MQPVEQLEFRLSELASLSCDKKSGSEYRNIQKKIYYIRNKERMNELCRTNYSEKREDYKDRHKSYYINNKEFLRIKSKEWVLSNTEKLKEYHRRYYQENKERIKSKVDLVKNTTEFKEKRKQYNNSLKRKESNRDFLYRKKYGMSIDEYNLILQEQNNCCAICKKDKLSSSNGKHKNLYIDHCHSTGEVRGLLCHKCNFALGMVDDNISTLLNCISYLEKFNAKRDNTNKGKTEAQ